jgi:hypothetical protein
LSMRLAVSGLYPVLASFSGASSFPIKFTNVV